MNAIKDSIKSGRTVVGTTVTPNVDVSILADACRGLMVTGAEATPIIQSLVWAAVIAAIFAPLSVWAFKRRV
mgnify:CR=1 FL=1